MPRKIAKRYLRIAISRQRKPQFKHGTTCLTVGCTRPAAMQLRDALDHRQAKTRVATAFAMATALKEALEDVR